MNINEFLKEIRVFGELKELKSEEETRTGYVFLVDSSKIISELSGLKPIPFLIQIKNEETMVLDFIVSKKLYKNIDMTRIINKINANFDYGKVYIDEEEDIIWRSTINLKSYNIDEFKKRVETGIYAAIFISWRVINNGKEQ